MSTKNDYPKLAARAADLLSPGVVAAIDGDIQKLKQEWLSLLELRALAVRLHGDTTAAPSMPDDDFKPSERRAEESLKEPGQQKEPSQEAAGELVSNLIEQYKNHEGSPYARLKHSTRIAYNSLLRRIEKDCGDWTLSDLDHESIEDLYAGWRDSGAKVAMGHALATMLRGLIHFGAGVLKNNDCVRIAVVLRTMRFEISQSRTERLTKDQARLIMDRAHEIKFPSLALAQALQIETDLSQKDVIGEWVPETEPYFTDVVHEGKKWIQGIRWYEIDEDMVLTRDTGDKKQDIRIDLKEKPLVMEELARQYPGAVWHDDDGNFNADRSKFPEDKPVIFCESTKKPWTPHEYRRRWRIMARDVGIPDNVYNMDSR